MFQRQIGLRWKVFLLLALLIGGANGALEYFRFQSINDVNDQLMVRRLARHSLTLGAEFDRMKGRLAGLAVQLASAHRIQDLVNANTQPFAPEFLSTLDWVEIHAQGARHVVWDNSVSGSYSGPQLAAAIREAQKTSQPAGFLACGDECNYIAAVPALDRDGKPLTLVLASSISELLFDYRASSNSDLVLLMPQSGTPVPDDAERSLWGHRVMGLTNATVLGPQLRAIAARQPMPEIGKLTAGNIDNVHLRMLVEPAPVVADPEALLVLRVVDNTETVEAIKALSRQHALQALMAIATSLSVLFLMLTFSTRKLTRITQALPLLADKRFSDAQALMAKSQTSRFPDEVDQLQASALQLTAQLQRLDVVEAESSAKSRFLATVSHEIRTPMNAIIGMSEILARSPLGDEQRQQATTILTSAQALLAIINDILDFSKLEAGRAKLEVTPMSLRKVVEGALSTFAGSARSKGVRMVEVVDPDLPAMVLGDAARLRQILVNLLSNALKFTEKGRIWVHVGSVSSKPDVVRLRFSVRDTGIGITPDQQARLFQPFMQAESSTTRRFGGTGLGLSICHALVTKMGGEIGVSSQPDEGSEFWFEIDMPLAEKPSEVDRSESAWLKGLHVTLSIFDSEERAGIARYLRSAGAEVSTEPSTNARSAIRVDDKLGGAMLHIQDTASGQERTLHQPVRMRDLLQQVATLSGRERRGAPREEDGELSVLPLPEQPSAGSASGLRCRVLVAEDDPTNQTVIETQLRRLSCEIRIVSDGSTVLPLLQPGHRYDILMTDLHMPGMDGFELARAVRANESARNLPRMPIIAFTADAASEVVARCRLLGMDDVLTKPVTLKSLDECLRRWAPNVPDGPVPVDTSVLSELLGGADEETLQKILGDFVRLGAEQIDALDAAVAQKDSSHVREIVHKLLGSTRSAGAKPLTEVLLRLQTAAREDRFDEYPSLGAECRREFERVRAWHEARSPAAAP